MLRSVGILLQFSKSHRKAGEISYGIKFYKISLMKETNLNSLSFFEYIKVIWLVLIK